MRQTRAATILSHGFAYLSGLVFLGPLYILVNLAVRPPTDLEPAIFPTQHPSFSNFAQAWTQSGLGSAMLTSVTVTSVSCVVILIFATMAAYPLARSLSRWSNRTFYFFLLGLLLPFQVAILPLYIQFRDLHLLGSPWALVLYYVGHNMPFPIFLITTFLRASVPLEYEEAARIDGCSDRRVFLVIVIPLLRPVLGTAAILVGLGIWNDFFTPLLYLSGSGSSTIPMALYRFVGTYSTNWPLVFAGLLISMAPILILYLVFQRYVIQGFAGGVKG